MAISAAAGPAAALLAVLLVFFAAIGPSAGPEAPPAACRNWTAGPLHACLLVRSYGAQLPSIPQFLSSLALSSVPLTAMYSLTDAGTDHAAFERAARGYAGRVLGCPQMVRVLPPLLDVGRGVRQRDIQPLLDRTLNASYPDYGYSVTDAALDAILGEDNAGGLAAELNCSHLILTNGDNLYATGFLDHLQPWLDRDIVGFDFSSRYDRGEWHGFIPGPDVVGGGPSGPLFAAFMVGAIDLGAAVFRVPFLRAQRLRPDGTGPPLRMLRNMARRFQIGLVAHTNYPRWVWLEETDGHFIAELAARAGEGRRAIVRRLLMFHQ